MIDEQVLWIALISNLALLIFVAAELRKLQGRARRWRTELRKLQGRARRWRTELRIPFTWFSSVEVDNEIDGREPYRDEQIVLSMCPDGRSICVRVEDMRLGYKALAEMQSI